MKQSGFPLLLKRAVDLGVGAAVAVVAAPVVALAALAIVATDGRPVFFVQERIGLGGRPFAFVKLRTMRGDRGREGDPRFDAGRITPLGRFLRSTSIDELPQLLNVFRGDMSLVGPRPLLPRYLPRYSPAQRRRHEVLPGITGLAQVRGRNAIAWAKKFEMDVWYVDHWSPRLDLSILLETAVIVLRRSNVASEGHVTMPEFMGDAEDGPTASG